MTVLRIERFPAPKSVLAARRLIGGGTRHARPGVAAR
jgi:hypothetical protein